MIRARVARMSVCGELGYEINCRYGDHITLRRTLLEGGRGPRHPRDRLQRAFCRSGWKRASASGTRNSPKATRRARTGMDRWIAWDKGAFIGREAGAGRTRGHRPRQNPRHAGDRRRRTPNASGFEPVWGRTARASGLSPRADTGHYHQQVAGHGADRDGPWHAPGTALAVHVVGVERAAPVSSRPRPTTPRGARCGDGPPDPEPGARALAPGPYRQAW